MAPKKASAANSIGEGTGRDFLMWLCTSCGGGKSHKEAKQIAKRAMKYLMNCTGENESDVTLSNELIDCCLGSTTILIRFLTTLEKEWKLSFSGSLNYIRAIEDLVDFRKANGVDDNSLRCFTITEVYLRRAKENFRKKKKLECTRHFDLEKLIARDSWATLEDMEKVIPYHIDTFKEIVEKSKTQTPLPTKTELVFCTKFVTTFLFLRVKCSRPMTFQYLTLPMINKARVNHGFIDQTEFKTAAKYLFDTLIITPDVFTVLDAYIDNVRPLLNPVCNYVLISTTGNQYQSLTTAMTMLVHEAIGKYIHPTRYRQIVETTSADRLTRAEQETISEDQKHSSTVAKIHYKKKQSRNVALEGKRCMEKMLAGARISESNDISACLAELRALNSSIVNDPVMQKSAEIVNENSCFQSTSSQTQVDREIVNHSPFKACSIIPASRSPDFSILQKTQSLMSTVPETIEDDSVINNDVEITSTLPSNSDLPSISKTYSHVEISSDKQLNKKWQRMRLGNVLANMRNLLSKKTDFSSKA